MATATHTTDFTPPTLIRDIATWVAWVALCLGVGAIGAFWTTPEINGWYATLERPTIAPPNWVFGPVWTTLYVLMGTAAWLVHRQGGFARQATPLTLFLVQLGLNLAWSLVFFNLHQIGWAFVDIVALWVAIAATIAAFAHRSAWAAGLMLPYIAWVTFAALVNYEFWRLNG